MNNEEGGMTNTQLIIESMNGKAETISDGNTCCLCGGDKTVEKWLDRKKVISSSFTDWNCMSDIDGQTICSFCVSCLGKELGLRNHSFVADQNGFKFIKHQEKWHYLWDYEPAPPYILAFTTTHKKHISFKAAIAYEIMCIDYTIMINTENEWEWFDRKSLKKVKDIIQSLYDGGITKSELLDCSITRSWYPEIIDLKSYKDTIQYKLIVDCVQKTEGEEQDEN
jgi:hypothetical protein